MPYKAASRPNPTLSASEPQRQPHLVALPARSSGDGAGGPRPEGAPVRVLLVDDDEESYLLIRTVLSLTRQTRFELEWTASYEEALEIIGARRHEAYLVDYRLGRRNGIELVREAIEGGCRAPVIVLTSLSGSSVDVEAIQAGAADFLDKGQIASEVLERSIRYSLERRRVEAALRASEERYALAAQSANDGLWDWSFSTDQIVYSIRWKAMLGYADDEIGDSPNEWIGRVHPEDVAQFQEKIGLHLERRTSHFEIEYRLMHKDGAYRWMLARGRALWDDGATAYRMAGAQTDITERKSAEESLVRKAFYDGLTGLPNRALFMDTLRRAVAAARHRRGYLFAVLFIDLDRFKVVNDSLGHLAGDELLVGIARRLEACLRPNDMLARLGGDEFTLLLDGIHDAGEAQAVAERIQKGLQPPFLLNGQEVFTSASIGITLGGVDPPDTEEILRGADMAMYRAKSRGKARYEFYNASQHAGALRMLQLETDLRRAVEHEELAVEYQPIVELPTGRVVGYEALTRWHHPLRGAVSPDEFIPLAEEAGLIATIGRWTLREACRQMAEWRLRFPSASDVAMSVNVSSRQFSRPDLLEHVREVIAETGLPASALRLEITETVLMENAESATTMLLHLKAMGVDLHLDDFGTGYSSLSYLHRFPIDALKIDRSFVSGMGEGEGKNREIVRSIVALGQNLGLEVIAEGVETQFQRELLRSLGCTHAQGYLFARPLPPAAAAAPLADRS